MAQHGSIVNGGIALSTYNHGANDYRHPQYDNLSQFSFNPAVVSNSWVKIMDTNFQQSMALLTQAQRTVQIMTASFLCEFTDTDSISTGSFILSLVFRYTSISPYNVIANVEIQPISESANGLNARAILAYKNTGNPLCIENEVQCYVQLPFAGDRLKMTTLYLHTNSAAPAKMNPVGDSYFFTNFQRAQGLFGSQISNTPITYFVLSTVNLVGYTTIDTDIYRPKSGYNIVNYASNKGNLALSNGWGCSYSSTQFPSFVIANALSYSSVYNTFCFNNTMAQPTIPNTTDIQFYYNIPNSSFVPGVYTITLYVMCDSATNLQFGIFNSSYIEITDPTLTPEMFTFTIPAGLTLRKFARRGTLTGVSNSIRIMLGEVSQNSNLYFAVKIESGYRSTDYSSNPNDIAPVIIPIQATPATITSPTYSVTAMNQLLKFDCTSNAIVITLPSASTFVGQSITIRKIDSINPLTINPNGTNTINSYATLVIQYKNSTVTFISDGTNWNLD